MFMFGSLTWFLAPIWDWLQCSLRRTPAACESLGLFLLSSAAGRAAAHKKQGLLSFSRFTFSRNASIVEGVSADPAHILQKQTKKLPVPHSLLWITSQLSLMRIHLMDGRAVTLTAVNCGNISVWIQILHWEGPAKGVVGGKCFSHSVDVWARRPPVCAEGTLDCEKSGKKNPADWRWHCLKMLTRWQWSGGALQERSKVKLRTTSRCWCIEALALDLKFKVQITYIQASHDVCGFCWSKQKGPSDSLSALFSVLKKTRFKLQSFTPQRVWVELRVSSIFKRFSRDLTFGCVFPAGVFVNHNHDPGTSHIAQGGGCHMLSPSAHATRGAEQEQAKGAVWSSSYCILTAAAFCFS